MNLRKQRRRITKAMLWRAPAALRWLPFGIPGTPNGDGTFTFANVDALKEHVIQIHQWDDEGNMSVEVQVVPL